jgi:ADP-ribose pyrophosphatase
MTRETHGKLRHSERIYQGKIFDVSRDQVLMPNGREVTLEIVRHPGSVVLLPMPDPDHVILVRQYRYVIDRWIWELPAGTIDRGETAEAAARRECHEDVGMLPEALESLGTFYPSPGLLSETMTFFRIDGLRETDESAAHDEDEHLHPNRFHVREIRQMIQLGEIQDMKTIVGMALL